MFQLIANVLAWFYGLIPNYAIAIALLTLAIMILLTPLTLKSTKSMLEMQRLQPEMRRLQAQYKGDRQKLNEEMMKLYKEHQINPLGGCLPLLLQAPVFIILFRVLNHLTQVCHQPTAATRCLNPTVPDGNFGASYVSHSSQLWKDLASGNTMKAFGLDLSKSALNVVQESFVRGLPYIALVLVVAATSYYQQRQISSRNTNQPANPQQQMLLKIMPALFAVISFAFQAGLIVYFLTSNLYRIAQNAYITRRFYREAGAAAAGATGGGPAAKPTPAKPAPTKDAKARPTPAKGDGNRPTPQRPQPRPQPRTQGKPAAPPAAPKGNPVRGARPTPQPTPRPTPKPPPKKKK
ncbi:MAG TPA: YidC/Oxa1 family membrane protein insertase [Acidimicrobiales bacterium]|nr:YidC/Oxa1 family membrane protein insertase [Acidimicrobiales bacterium]